MKKHPYIFLLPVMIAFTFMFSACEKNGDGPDTDQAVTIAEDDALTDQLFDDVFSETDNALATVDMLLFGNGKKSAGLVTCPVITVDHNDTTYWPKTVTVNFGDSCTGPNGVVRSGKILITVTGRHLREGSVRTVAFENYHINGFKLAGTKTVSNQGLNENGSMIFNISLTGGKVTTPSGKEITREFTREREWFDGLATPRWIFDDKFLVTGSSSGINRFGVNYTKTIVSPLLIEVSCRWIKSGTIRIERTDRPLITLDYGDGECDNEATVTVEGETRTITLSPK